MPPFRFLNQVDDDENEGSKHDASALTAVPQHGVCSQDRVAAKIRVTHTESGESFVPERAIKTMPQRSRKDVKHYFYARGSYEVAVPPGRYQVEVVRGIAHEAVVAYTEVGSGITNVHDFESQSFEICRLGAGIRATLTPTITSNSTRIQMIVCAWSLPPKRWT